MLIISLLGEPISSEDNEKFSTWVVKLSGSPEFMVRARCRSSVFDYLVKYKCRFSDIIHVTGLEDMEG